MKNAHDKYGQSLQPRGATVQPGWTDSPHHDWPHLCYARAPMSMMGMMGNARCGEAAPSQPPRCTTSCRWAGLGRPRLRRR